MDNDEMQYLVNEGVLWICERIDDVKVAFYAIFKHEDDDYSSLAIDLSDDEFAQVGTTFTTLENLRPFLKDVLQAFYKRGGTTRGSMYGEMDSYDIYSEFAMSETIPFEELKNILETELTCTDVSIYL